MSEQEQTPTFSFDHLHSLEFLEANGLGGYASSTFSGGHSRKYHGLLVASLKPPVQRMVMVSKIDETLLAGEHVLQLGSNQFPSTLYPQGFRFITEIRHDPFPRIVYKTPVATIAKTIVAVHDENTTLVLYDVVDCDGKFTIQLQPFYSCRDIHHTTHKNDHIGHPYIFDNGVFRTMNYQGCPEFFIQVPKSRFIENQTWYQRFEYKLEQERGLEYKEDLFSHGSFEVLLKKGSKLGVIISLENPEGRDAYRLCRAEKKRRDDIVKEFTDNKVLTRLMLAADQFIVKRENLKTIIAGYPWFTDWGRDTMIAIPGLCLTTGRTKEARGILQKFSEHMHQGLLPNRFPDSGEQPEYNTIDATLWFFVAVYKYYLRTNDKAFVKSLMPVLRDSIDWHYRGTHFNIHVDSSDELLVGGQKGVQLTWMDAKVGGWVVTPRAGKPVEINALWYNALRIMEFFMKEMNVEGDQEFYNLKANLVLKNFNRLFWNPELNCLFDHIDGTYKNADIRPNQVYALSLPFPLVDKRQGYEVLKIVKAELLTPRGLRSLSPRHSEYRGVYDGDVLQRDGAYHQGTVWSHLLGPYIDALFYVFGGDAKTEALTIIQNMSVHLDEGGIGSISEIFDGNSPHLPRGCFAQAWSVAELLRVAVDHEVLSARPQSLARPVSIL
jgi:predicted glycogen debranching enzyme